MVRKREKLCAEILYFLIWRKLQSQLNKPTQPNPTQQANNLKYVRAQFFNFFRIELKIYIRSLIWYKRNNPKKLYADGGGGIRKDRRVILPGG